MSSTNYGHQRGRVSWYVPVAGALLMIIAVVAALGAMGSGVASVLVQTATDTSSRSFTVSGTPKLVLSDQMGDVRVEAGSSDQVVVRYTRHGRGITRSMAQDNLNQHKVTVRRSRNTVSVNVTGNSDQGPFGSGQVDLEVTVPRRTNVDANLNAGDFRIQGLTGSVTADVDAGDVRLTGMELTGTSRITLAAGDVRIAGEPKPNSSLRVAVSKGDVRLILPQSTNAHLEATTSLGGLSIRGWQQTDRNFERGGQTVSKTIGSAPRADLEVTVSMGDITIVSSGQEPDRPESG